MCLALVRFVLFVVGLAMLMWTLAQPAICLRIDLAARLLLSSVCVVGALVWGQYESARKNNHTRARRVVTTAIRVLVCLMVAIAWHGRWPLRVLFALSRPQLEAVAATAIVQGVSGRPVPSGRWMGAYYVKSIEVVQVPDGGPLVFLATYEDELLGREGFQFAPGAVTGQPGALAPGWRTFRLDP